jgi:hypothetical protein
MSERQDIAQGLVGGLHGLPLDTRQTGTTELAEIVVFIDGRSETAGILEFAGTVAEEHSAHLIGVFMQPEIPATPTETFATSEQNMLRCLRMHRIYLPPAQALTPHQIHSPVGCSSDLAIWHSPSPESSYGKVAGRYPLNGY